MRQEMVNLKECCSSEIPEEKGWCSWEGTHFDGKIDASSNMTGGEEEKVGVHVGVADWGACRAGSEKWVEFSSNGFYFFCVKCEVRLITQGVEGSYISGLKR